MTLCPRDGSVREATYNDRISVVWRCPWCREVTIERFEEEA